MWNKGVIYLMIVVFTLVSCRAKKEAPRQDASAMEVTELVKHMKDAGVQFDWLSARFNAHYTSVDKQQLSLGGFLRIRNDSVIWVSISPIVGIELARAVISRDTVKMVNRLNSTFFVGDMDYINQLLQTDIDYEILQALLVGNDFPYYEDDVFKSSVTGGYHHLSTLGRRKLKKYVEGDDEKERVLIQDIFLDPETYRIRRQEIKQVGSENRKIELSYDDYRDISGQLFPHSIKCLISVEGSLSIEVEISHISTEGPLNMPFSIPDSYTQPE